MSGLSFGWSGGQVDGTWFGPLLVSVKQYLASLPPSGGLVPYSQDAIWTYLGRPEDLMDHPPRENFLVITMASGSLNQAIAQGSGNFAPAMNGKIQLTQFARLFEDRAVQDQKRIEKATIGLSDQSRQLFKALEMWSGQVSGVPTTSPLVQPARLEGEIRFNARKIPLGWASCDSTWSIPFNADLS
jgi:hypothetical protein